MRYLALLAAALVGTSSSSATISGVVKGVPAKPAGRRFGIVTAVRLDTRSIAAVKQFTGAPWYRFSLPKGVYVLFGDVVDGTRTYSGHSWPFTATKSRHVDVDRGLSTHAVATRALQATSSSGVVLDPTNIRWSHDGRVNTTAIYDMLLTELFQASLHAPCKPAVSVAGGPDMAKINAELELQKSPFVDPSTRVTPHILQATHEITGSVATDASGASHGTFTMRDLKTGETTTVTVGDADFWKMVDQLTGAAERLVRAACKPDFPARYAITNVSVGLQSSGGQVLPGGPCADMSGTRSFASQSLLSSGAPSEIDLLSTGQLSGSINAYFDGAWSHDVLHGCNFAPDGTIVPCTYAAPSRPEASSGVSFVLDPQRPGAALAGHWQIPDGEIGFVDGTPNCGFTPYVDKALPDDASSATYPLTDFTEPGPHTITFAGTHHFDDLQGGFIEELLDLTWSVSVTFKRI